MSNDIAQAERDIDKAVLEVPSLRSSGGSLKHVPDSPRGCEVLAPARPLRRPSELLPRPQIGCSLRASERRDANCADCQPGDPWGDIQWSRCIDELGEAWQPLRNRGRVVVDDVVGP
jgi:hypothetical protein